MLSVGMKAEYLRRAKPFAALDAPGLAILAERAGERSASAGEVVVEEGEPGDTIYVVCEGHVEVARGEGTDEVVVATLGPGEFFGEMAPLSGRVRTATVRAAEETLLVFVRGKALQLLIQYAPDVAFALLGALSERLDAATDVIVDLVSTNPPLGRLAVVEGPDAGREFLLRRRHVTIGRATGSVIGDLHRYALHEPESAVAVEHAELLLEAGRTYLIPLTPEHQTRLNGTRIEATVELRPGDRIGIGTSEIRFDPTPTGD